MLLAGCDGGSTRTVTTAGQSQSLQFTAETRAAYRRGETVSLTFTVKNTGAEAVPYSFGGCGEYYTTVAQGARRVAVLAEGGPCTGDMKQRSFVPGEVRIFTMRWDQQGRSEEGFPTGLVPPGEYSLKAKLDVYTLGSEQFLTPNGYQIPDEVGAAPITITIR